MVTGQSAPAVGNTGGPVNRVCICRPFVHAHQMRGLVNEHNITEGEDSGLLLACRLRQDAL